jgi:capsule polysaccharide modification protein KpsS
LLSGGNMIITVHEMDKSHSEWLHVIQDWNKTMHGLWCVGVSNIDVIFNHYTTDAVAF